MAKRVRFFLNGQPVEIKENINRRLLDVLREDLNLTGTKEGCGEGVCGACTVIVNGALIHSCLTPVNRVDGSQVTTIEGLGSPEAPHPIQQAFVDAGAVQCGYCTPGMVLATRVLLEANPQPKKEEIVASLSGHLCRCTGYVKIIEAVGLAARRLQGQREMRPEPKGILGVSYPRPEAIFKATGRARYCVDLKMPGMLYGKILRSPHSHARIQSIDTSRAEALDGVVRVLTGKDVTGLNRFGLVVADQPILAEDRVRYQGEPLACVVARDETTAAKGVTLLRVEYERLPELKDPEEALAPEAPRIHDEGNLMPLMEPPALAKGDVEKGFREAAVIVEQTYVTPRNEHAYLEPEAGVGYIDEEGRVTVRLGTQSIHDDQENICRALGLPQEKVRVIQNTAGGSFGGKYDPHLACLLALCAHLVKRPVKIQYNRRESFLATVKRHPFWIRHKLGATKEGRLTAMEIEYLADVGAYRAMSPAVMRVAPLQASGPYYYPNILIKGKAVFTNNPPSSAMRGFGTPQFHFACESQMDLLADKLGMDPWELRLINGLDEGKDTVTGQLLSSYAGLKNSLFAVSESYDRLKAWAREPGDNDVKRGVGLACTWFGTGKIGRKDTAEAWLDLNRDGRICIYSGAADCGQGQNPALRQMAAQALNLPLTSLDLVAGDTALTPMAQATVSSRILYTSGKVIIEAAEKLRKMMLEQAARLLEEGVEGLQLKEGYIEGASGRRLTYQELASVLSEEGIALRGIGKYESPATLDPKTGKGSPYPTFCFGTQVVAVEVNTHNGQVAVKKIVAAHDVGRAVNPINIEGQIEGGIAMGLGFALSEEFIPGQTRKLSDYHIPKMNEMPEVEIFILEEAEPSGPFGARGIGEPSLLPVAPAIANAIEDACGVRVCQLPLKPLTVLAALSSSGS